MRVCYRNALFGTGFVRVEKDPKPSVPVVWNSSGYEKVETLRLFEGLVDVSTPI